MDIMVDLETWGQRPGCSLRSIGAVVFSLSGDPPVVRGADHFYRNIDRADCKALGLREEQGTVDWWARQDKAAQDALLADPKPLAEVVRDFDLWWRGLRAVRVWAQGSNFDPGLWETACRVVGREAPWKFYDTRDTRTLYDVARFDPRTLRRAGTYHNALDDCRYQVQCCRAAYEKLHGGAGALRRDPANFTTKVD